MHQIPKLKQFSPRRSCSCHCPINWSQVLSRKWCSWSSADRRCSNCIWVMNKFIAYKGAPHIKGLTAVQSDGRQPMVLSFPEHFSSYFLFIHTKMADTSDLTLALTISVIGSIMLFIIIISSKKSSFFLICGFFFLICGLINAFRYQVLKWQVPITFTPCLFCQYLLGLLTNYPPDLTNQISSLNSSNKEKRIEVLAWNIFLVAGYVWV